MKVVVKKSLNKIIILSVLVLGLVSGLMVLSKNQVFDSSKAGVLDPEGLKDDEKFKEWEKEYRGSKEYTKEKDADYDSKKDPKLDPESQYYVPQGAGPLVVSPIILPPGTIEYCGGSGAGAAGCFCTTSNCYFNIGGKTYGCSASDGCTKESIDEFLKDIEEDYDIDISYNESAELVINGYVIGDYMFSEANLIRDAEGNIVNFNCGGGGCDSGTVGQILARIFAGIGTQGVREVSGYQGGYELSPMIPIPGGGGGCSSCNQKYKYKGSTSNFTTFFSSAFTTVYSYLQTGFGTLWPTVWSWIQESASSLF